MRCKFLIKTSSTVLFAFVFMHSIAAETMFDPDGIFLTWQRDPLTTMTIDWNSEEIREPLVEYRKLGEEGYWLQKTGESFPFPFSERTVHRVELRYLSPGTTYEFRFGTDSKVYRFRTMPENLVRPLRIAVGGDTRHTQEWMEATNRQATNLYVDFIVWGGDLAYADGREDRLHHWYEWFDANKNTLITEEGRIIPVVLGIGNHEVRGGYYSRHEEFEANDTWRAQIAPYFYTLFAFPGQPGYNVLDFGDYLSIVMLDTDHTNPVEGTQTEWLETVLEERKDIPHLIPVYHIPAYPGHRGFEGSTSQRIREHWVPLFEKYGVKVAFENHDHVYKRTHPILNGEINANGIVYLGDGAWGVEPRSGHNPDEVWYLKERISLHHLILLTLQGKHQHFIAIDSDGNVIDTYPERTVLEE